MERQLDERAILALRNGNVELFYGGLGSEGDKEGLRIILKAAFPQDRTFASGQALYYKASSDECSNYLWVTDDVASGKPSMEVKDFFISQVNNYEIY